MHNIIKKRNEEKEREITSATGAENRTATFLEKIRMPFRSTHDILNAVVETCVSRNFVSNNNHAKEKGI